MSPKSLVSKLVRCAPLSLAFVALASPARAHCREKACDDTLGECPVDEHRCVTTGAELFWPGGRVAVTVNGSGSSLRGVSGEELRAVMVEALTTWISAECEGGHPSIHAAEPALAEGAAPSFFPHGRNTSVVTFDDAGWPYAPDQIGKTALGFSLESGELLDADVRLNSESFSFSAGAPGESADLLAVLTHEAGHLLGLGHSDVPGATMQPDTSGPESVELRTLEQDDVDGICAIYPPGAPPEPPPGDGSGERRVGTSGDSGCSVVGHADGGRFAAASALALGLLGLRRSRRKRG